MFYSHQFSFYSQTLLFFHVFRFFPSGKYLQIILEKVAKIISPCRQNLTQFKFNLINNSEFVKMFKFQRQTFIHFLAFQYSLINASKQKNVKIVKSLFHLQEYSKLKITIIMGIIFLLFILMFSKSKAWSKLPNQTHLQLIQTMQSSGSSAFKSVGRQKTPSLIHRFPKCDNDLVYQVKDQLTRPKIAIKVNNYKIEPGAYDQPRLKRKSTSLTQVRQKNHEKEINKKYQETNSTKHAQIMNLKYGRNDNAQKTIKTGNQNNKINKFGLCNFQFQKTILGKIEKNQKRSHHIAFEKQVHRNPNQNKIWYDRHVEHKHYFNQRQSIDKLHSFKSYTQRKVFTPKDDLDVFYNFSSGMKLTKPVIKQQFYDMQKPSGRKDAPKKEGNDLDYKIQNSIKKTQPTTLTYRFSKSERKLVFGKQVISKWRGCSR